MKRAYEQAPVSSPPILFYGPSWGLLLSWQDGVSSRRVVLDRISTEGIR